jgi:hypothetical protein
VLAKLNNVASVPRRDRLNIESVVMGVDGKTGPKTSPIGKDLKIQFNQMNGKCRYSYTAQSDGRSRTSENVATEFRVRNDGRLFDGNVEESQNMRPILQIQQE